MLRSWRSSEPGSSIGPNTQSRMKFPLSVKTGPRSKQTKDSCVSVRGMNEETEH
jgi:hypothetical protein